MVKPVYFSAVAFVVLSSVLGAWGLGSPDGEQRKMPLDDAFPFNPQQAWAVEESLLVWRPYEDETDYAAYQSTKIAGSISKIEYQVKHPTFKWGTGVRLKFMRYLPSNDPWDIDLLGTYYYSQGKDDVNVNPAHLGAGNLQKKIIPAWDEIALGTAAKAQTNVSLNFFNFDLIAGRHYSLTRKIDIHPFVGIRSVLLFQKYKTSYLSTSSLTFAPLANHSFKGEHSFWGVGPRIGTDLVMHLGRQWSFLATLGASFFAGRYNVQEAFKGSRFIGFTDTPLNEKVKDKEAILRSNLDASLGLGWEKWVKKGTVRIAPSFAFEVSEWFAIKRWVDLHTLDTASSSGPTVHSHRRYSDLGLMGFNINLQVDF